MGNLFNGIFDGVDELVNRFWFIDPALAISLPALRPATRSTSRFGRLAV